MKYVFSIAITGIFFFLIPNEVHALVVIPALILIPLAKLLAILFASLSFPAAFLGFITSKLTNVSSKKAILIAILLLAIIIIGVGVYAKLYHPQWPLIS